MHPSLLPGGCRSSALASNRTLLAAWVDADGHLYLKSSAASEPASAILGNDSQVSLPSPNSTKKQQPQGSRKLLLATQPELPVKGSGRKLLVTNPDGRVEIDTSAYPYSAVGLLISVKTATSDAICTGTLIGPRSVLTAGHCVYDTVARQFYDYTEMVFIPDQRGGSQASQYEMLHVQSVSLMADRRQANEGGSWCGGWAAY